jgi:hypothetical protein
MRLDMADAVAQFLRLELLEKPNGSTEGVSPRWWVIYYSAEKWNASGTIANCRKRKKIDWSCNEHTRKGDFALLYVKRPVSAIVAIVVAMDNADNTRSHPKYPTEPWWCHVQFQRSLKNPLTISAMRNDPQLRRAWSLVRAQFQPDRTKSPGIDDEVVKLLRSRIPEMKSVELPTKIKPADSARKAK